jgi:hypothetical protein
MSTEALILTHVAALFAGVTGTWSYLRHVAGWSTAFETKISAQIAHLMHLVGSPTGQVVPPQSPVPAAPAATTPVAVGAISVPAATP